MVPASLLFMDLFSTPTVTPGRVRLAYAIAVTTDALQFALGPFGWVAADEAFDVLAAIALTRVLGFHYLLLPTFVVEFLPVVDMLPTWTACTALVVSMRKRDQIQPAVPPSNGPIIDI